MTVPSVGSVCQGQRLIPVALQRYLRLSYTSALPSEASPVSSQQSDQAGLLKQLHRLARSLNLVSFASAGTLQSERGRACLSRALPVLPGPLQPHWRYVWDTGPIVTLLNAKDKHAAAVATMVVTTPETLNQGCTTVSALVEAEQLLLRDLKIQNKSRPRGAYDAAVEAAAGIESFVEETGLVSAEYTAEYLQVSKAIPAIGQADKAALAACLLISTNQLVSVDAADFKRAFAAMKMRQMNLLP